MMKAQFDFWTARGGLRLAWILAMSLTLIFQGIPRAWSAGWSEIDPRARVCPDYAPIVRDEPAVPVAASFVPLMQISAYGGNVFSDPAMEPSSNVAMQSSAAGEGSGRFAILDATGAPFPIEGTQVDVLAGKAPSPYESLDLDALQRVPLEYPPVNAKGELSLWAMRPGAWAGQPDVVAVIVANPDYGAAVIRRTVAPEDGKLRLPLVRRDSPERALAITGRALTPEGQPVPGALVRVRRWTPHVEGYEPWMMGELLLTDGDGRFACYTTEIHKNPPLTSTGPVRASLGVKETNYDALPSIILRGIYGGRWVFGVTVRFPGAYRLLPGAGLSQGEQDLEIVGRRGAAFHRFVFEMPDGLRTGDTMPETYGMGFQKTDQGPDCLIPRSIARHGGMVPYGVYQPIYSLPGRSELTTFPPVTIDADSPEEIVFRQRPGRTFQGRLLDAQTGAPLAGALVFSPGLGDHTINEADWNALDGIAVDTPHDSAEFNSVPFLSKFKGWTRTAADGSWTLTEPADFGFTMLYFDARDHLSMMGDVRRPSVGSPPKPIPPLTVRLWPAAHLRLTIPGPPLTLQQQPFGVYVTWSVADGQRSWVDFNSENNPIPSIYFHPVSGIMVAPSAATEVAVPADLRFQISLRPPDDQAQSTLPREFSLAKGETLDLGTVQLEDKVLAGLLVVDQSGNPLAGMPVCLLEGDDHYGTHYQTTDTNGGAIFFVPRGRPVRMAVRTQFGERSPEHVRTIDVTTTASATADPVVHTLELDPEFIASIRKEME